MNKLLVAAIVASCSMGAIAMDHADQEKDEVGRMLTQAVHQKILQTQQITKEELKSVHHTWVCEPTHAPETVKLQEGKNITVEHSSPMPTSDLHITLRVPTQDDPTPGHTSNLLVSFNCNKKK